MDAAKNLYGTTFVGGAYGGGTVFKLAPGSNGGWSFSVLHSFCRTCSDGFGPLGALILDSTGNLYGTAALGGAGNGGTVFKLTPNADGSWTEKVLYSFIFCVVTDCVDGNSPAAGLLFDAAGNLYGTTQSGGTLNGGTVFKLTPSQDSWTESLLYNFCGITETCAAGSNPMASLIFDESGSLYGTTAFGGRSTACPNNGCGVVFKLSPQTDGSWTESVLHTFNGRDGASFPSSLIFDSAGNLYGTTAYGGNLSLCNSGGGNGCGVVFQLTPDANGSWTENVLRRFTGADGREPNGGVVMGVAGNLYGTTTRGGNACDCGIVFELAPKLGGGRSETGLYRFLNRPGNHPVSGLTLDAAGNLLGTTQGDLTTTFGSVFEVTR
jgi:uncharacterized repeat protein (TIGR03803 family)